MKKFMVISLMLVAVLGCSGEKKPEGFPKTVAVTVSVMQENAPLADAQLSLIPEDQSLSRWPVTGTTDESGNAKLTTYGRFNGCPLGKFKVTVTKDEIDVKTKEVPPGVDPADVKTSPGVVHSLVELKYTDPEKTTLTVNIEEGTKEIKLDVGKKVRVFKSRVPN